MNFQWPALFPKRRMESGWMAFSFQPDGLNYVHLRQGRNGRPEATHFGWRQLSVGEREGFRKLSRELFASRFPSILVLGSDEYQLLSMEAPGVPKEERKTAMRWKIRDMIDYRIDDATFDMLEIPGDPAQPFRDPQIYAVIAKNEILSERMALFARAEIPLSVIDIPEMAQRNLASFFETESKALAMLSFGIHKVLLTITSEGQFYLSRHIDIARISLQDREEAVRLDAFERLTLELQRSLDHFEHQYNHIALDRLMLGPLPGVEDLSGHLARNLQIPVEKTGLENWIDFTSTPELAEPEWQARCWLSLGAALREVEP